MISIVCAYNNKDILESMLMKSLKNQDFLDYELITVNNKELGFSSAAETLNYGFMQSKGDLIIFAHQDIEFLESDSLSKIYKYASENEFGLAGLAGIDDDNLVYSSVLQGKSRENAGIRNCVIKEVEMVDEVLMITRRNLFHGFDNANRTWHLYGLDISLMTKKMGGKIVLLPIPIYHLSPGYSLNSSYFERLKQVCAQNKELKIVRTTMGIFKNDRLLSIRIFIYKLKRFIKINLLRKEG